MIPNVLSIAGVVAALTAQNTHSVTGVQAVPVEFIAQQIDTLFADVRIAAVKLGIHGTTEVVTTVSAARIVTKNTHGTGCTLSAAIAASGELSVGSGRGPVHHFDDVWPPARS
jgi:hydroxymethylpyrimidine/phosphomethylpyrimidine kinase